MKKDLDWVIQEIHATRKVLADSESSGNETADEFTFNNGKEEGLVIALKLLDQLDEPEVLSKEWIDENKSLINGRSTNPDGTEGDCYDAHYIHVLELQNLLVPKQEEVEEGRVRLIVGFDGGTESYYATDIGGALDFLTDYDARFTVNKEPMIPNCVAKWISIHHEQFDLYPALKRLESNALSWEDVYEWYRRNTYTFVNAYLTGKYEVGEEQKYYVVNKNGSLILVRNTDTEYDDTIAYAVSGRLMESVVACDEEHLYQFTEQEIKDYDERYWPFAVKVEELEE